MDPVPTQGRLHSDLGLPFSPKVQQYHGYPQGQIQCQIPGQRSQTINSGQQYQEEGSLNNYGNVLTTTGLQQTSNTGVDHYGNTPYDTVTKATSDQTFSNGDKSTNQKEDSFYYNIHPSVIPTQDFVYGTNSDCRIWHYAKVNGKLPTDIQRISPTPGKGNSS